MKENFNWTEHLKAPTKVEPDIPVSAKKANVPKEVKMGELQGSDYADLNSEVYSGVKNAKDLVKYILEQKLAPATLSDEAALFMGVSTCIALGIDSFGKALSALKNMYVFDGKLHLFGELPLAIVESSGLMDSIEEFFVDKEGNKICWKNKNLSARISAAVCIVKRKGGISNEFYLTEEDLVMSGGKRNPDGSWIFMQGKRESFTWKKYPSGHWRLRLRRTALKSVFPDVLGGINLGINPENIVKTSGSSIQKTYGLTQKKTSCYS